MEEQLLFDIKDDPWGVIAGVDEAGRGPLAGPVVAAACILPEFTSIEGIQDSKKMNPDYRQHVYEQLTQEPQIIWAIGIVDVEEIDRINILRASLEAMRIAIEKLPCKPDFLLVDGLHLPVTQIPGRPVVDGDNKYLCISAASIIAKVTRDARMLEYHEQWPQYGFDRHKGYATEDHLNAIEKYGPCPIHRVSFSPFAISTKR